MTVCLVGTPDPADGEPSALELLLLEAERPVLEAELAVVAAECAYMAAPSALARARVRRAEACLGHMCAAAGRPTPPPLVADDRGVNRTEDDVEGVA